MPALEPLRGAARRRRSGRPRRRPLARAATDGDRPPARARTRPSPSAPTTVDIDDAHAIVESTSPGSSAPGCRSTIIAHHIEWPLPSRATGPRPGRRSPACRPSVWLPDDGDALLVTRRGRTRDELADARLAPMSELHATRCSPIRWAGRRPKPAYDVVIIGGGGHGLSTAYYLATRHGITNVAVLEADYIASGNTGRNTTIIRANYGIPEAVRFYQHSLELLPGPRGRDRRRRSSTRPRASSGWPTPRWRCGPSAPGRR